MSFEEVKAKAIKYVGISKKTEYEIRNKLISDNTSNAIIDDVIAYLIELGYINDTDYIESYIRQNIRLQKYSIYELTEKLKQKGVSKEIITFKMQELRETEYEKRVIDKLIASKGNKMDEMKLKQYLFRRGFRFEES